MDAGAILGNLMMAVVIGIIAFGLICWVLDSGKDKE